MAFKCTNENCHCVSLKKAVYKQHSRGVRTGWKSAMRTIFSIPFDMYQPGVLEDMVNDFLASNKNWYEALMTSTIDDYTNKKGETFKAHYTTHKVFEAC